MIPLPSFIVLNAAVRHCEGVVPILNALSINGFSHFSKRSGCSSFMSSISALYFSFSLLTRQGPKSLPCSLLHSAKIAF